MLSGLLLLCFSDVQANQSPVVERLEQQLPKLIQQAGIPGISLAYIESGKLEWLGEFGVSNAEKTVPVTANTVFEAASLSKPVLAYIVLKMVERHQLSLDTPLHTIFEEPRLLQKDYARLLTPRLILSHQSGLPNWGWGQGQLKFNRQPGMAFGYSGEGYVYLQKALEKLSGLSYQELARKEVFEPLQMTNSRFTWKNGDSFPRATGHNQAGSPVSRPIPDANAAASLNTTATDYAKFIIAWMNSENLSGKSSKLAFEPITRLPEKNGAPVETRAEKLSAAVLTWGLGWGLMQFNSKKIAWHWGDNGVFRAFTAIDPAKQTGFVYLTNSQNGLAVAEAITTTVIGDPSPIINWLDYGQSDSPIWQRMRQGYIAESNKNYKAAINQFKKVVAGFPDNQNLRNRIKWLETLQKVKHNKVVLKEIELKQIAGRYGDRLITLKQGQLYYRRNGGNEYMLKPMTKSLFSVGNIFEFRLEAVSDKNGKIVKLLGHYIDRPTDESPRTD